MCVCVMGESFYHFNLLFSHMPYLRLKKKTYIKYLEEVMLFLIEGIAAGKPCVCQQDSRPRNTNRRTKYWLSENFCDHITFKIWQPILADYNPLDYYVWCAVELEIHKTVYCTKEELKEKTTAAFTNQTRRPSEKLAGNSKVVREP